jgi:hypothetical protein
MRLSLDKLTKTALREMLEDALFRETQRSKPMHKRGGEKKEKDEATEEQDEESEKVADLDEEMHGKPNPVDMDDEDMSDEAMEDFDREAEEDSKKKPKGKSAKKSK